MLLLRFIEFNYTKLSILSLFPFSLLFETTTAFWKGISYFSGDNLLQAYHIYKVLYARFLSEAANSAANAICSVTMILMFMHVDIFKNTNSFMLISFYKPLSKDYR